MKTTETRGGLSTSARRVLSPAKIAVQLDNAGGADEESARPLGHVLSAARRIARIADQLNANTVLLAEHFDRVLGPDPRPGNGAERAERTSCEINELHGTIDSLDAAVQLLFEQAERVRAL